MPAPARAGNTNAPASEPIPRGSLGHRDQEHPATERRTRGLERSTGPGVERGLEPEPDALEEPRFDPVAGRVETTWFWSGPRGSGQKSASIRVYTITELVRLLERVRLRPVPATQTLLRASRFPAGV